MREITQPFSRVKMQVSTLFHIQSHWSITRCIFCTFLHFCTVLHVLHVFFREATTVVALARHFVRHLYHRRRLQRWACETVRGETVVCGSRLE